MDVYGLMLRSFPEPAQSFKTSLCVHDPPGGDRPAGRCLCCRSHKAKMRISCFQSASTMLNPSIVTPSGGSLCRSVVKFSVQAHFRRSCPVGNLQSPLDASKHKFPLSFSERTCANSTRQSSFWLLIRQVIYADLENYRCHTDKTKESHASTIQLVTEGVMARNRSLMNERLSTAILLSISLLPLAALMNPAPAEAQLGMAVCSRLPSAHN